MQPFSVNYYFLILFSVTYNPAVHDTGSDIDQSQFSLVLTYISWRHGDCGIQILFVAEAHSGIPVVLVLVEGGYDAIKDVSRSIEARIPCVVCEGTGRAADILSYAYHHYVTTRK